MAKCVWGPMQVFIDGVLYGVVDGYNLVEGGLISETNATLSGNKTRTGEFMLWELTGGTLDGCIELPTERCGLTVVLVLLANVQSEDPETLKSVTFVDADINGRASQALGGNGAYSDLSIKASTIRKNYGRAA